MICIQCKTEIEPSKGTKPRLYCSDACRKAHKRANGQIDKQTDIIEMETDKPLKDRPIRNMEFCSKHKNTRKVSCGCK